jgi:hypothetical protein
MAPAVRITQIIDDHITYLFTLALTKARVYKGNVSGLDTPKKGGTRMKLRTYVAVLVVALMGVGCDESAEVKDGFTFNLDDDVSITVRFLAGGYSAAAVSECNGAWPIEFDVPRIEEGMEDRPGWFVVNNDQCGNDGIDQATGRIASPAASGVSVVDNTMVRLWEMDDIYNGIGTVDKVEEATGKIVQFTVGGTVFVAE